MASSSQLSSSSPIVTFFGTCPTLWEHLSPDQRDSCIAQVHLVRQVEGYFAWIATGELARQWNENGYQEYSAVIEYGRFRIGRPGLGRDRIATHDLRLLSTTPDRERATPFVIITSKNLKRAQETVNRLQKHPRLCKFGFQYMARQGGLKLTAGDPSSKSTGLSGHLRGLCGARIAVYKHGGASRGEKKNVATIGGVFRIGQKYFALTAAHVFFDNIASTGSWADSGLYVTTESSIGGVGMTQDAPRPEVFGSYEILVESFWPHIASNDGETQNPSTSLGLFEPQVTHRRKGVKPTTSSEVIWNFEMDWALLELKDPGMCGPNTLHISSKVTLELKPPVPNLEPPNGAIIIAAGVSGPVHGMGLGTVGGVMFPWSSKEIQAWSTETEIAVGDCGSVVVCPDRAVTYGFVVAHDSETMMTYFVPALAVFESIARQCGLPSLSLQDIFSLTSSQVGEMDAKVDLQGKADVPLAPSREPASDFILQTFTDILASYTVQNVDRKKYVLTTSLREWLLTKANPNASHLDLLLDLVYSPYLMVPIDADKVSGGNQECLLVFSILLELGRGVLIDKFQEHGLIDSRLPFALAQVADIVSKMEVSDTDELAQGFSEKQWAYIPMHFDYGASYVCPPQRIVPIHQRQRINDKGGIATLWQIVVPEAFVDHELRRVAWNARYNDPSDNLGYRYQFALKSFKSRQHNLFDSERSALRALRDVDGTIRCLCDYIHEGEDSDHTCNVILEYGELDLDEYFYSRAPPVRSPDIMSFWRKMFDIATAIANIHQFAKLRAGVMQAYSGLHGDIKPDNILWVQERFKLADPGFARFEKSGRGIAPPLGGTRTYGSPEQGDGRHHITTNASQAVDVWSLGCVFSLAATWIVLGTLGIEEFNNIRIAAREKAGVQSKQSLDHPHGKIMFGKANSFHDDKEVLPEVLEWHADLRSWARRSDCITESVLDLLDRHMLVANPSSRVKIQEVCSEIDSIINQREPRSGPLSLQLRRAPGPRLFFPESPRSTVGEPLNVVHSHDSDRKSLVSAPKLQERVLTLAKRDSSPSLGADTSPSSITAEDVVLNPRSSGNRSGSTRLPPRSEVRSLKAQRSPSRRLRTSRGSLYQTVFQVQEEMQRTKKNALNHFSIRGRTYPRDDILSRYLYTRDLTFLVDNAESMEEHWEEATTVLATLMYKAKGIDKDGIDLWFTTGSVQLRNCTKSKQLVEGMKGKGALPRPGLHTDMNRSLGVILSSYLQQIKNKTHSTTLKDIEKGFTLIVLTDGAWAGMRQENAISLTISDFFKSLHRVQGHSLVQRPVSIEFIRFGNDARAIESLKRLDFELKDQEISDIVDTTPSMGNVYKMLLGSFMEEYDDQETDVED